MRKAFYGFIILLFLFAAPTYICSQQKINITDWKFRQSGKEQFYYARVPGCVHKDLIYNNLIEDPFIGTNENRFKWIEEENWEYTGKFDVPKNLISGDFTEIVFEGLDTYTEIFLNGYFLGKTDNMFRRWVFDVRNYIKEKDNELKVYFQSPIRIGDSLKKIYPIKFPVTNDIYGTSVFTRKAPYQYGWDWAPRLVTSGIWKNVYLRFGEKYLTENLIIRNKTVSSVSAELEAEFSVKSRIKQTITADFYFYGITGNNKPLGDNLAARIIINAELEEGVNRISFPFKVDNPKLWWCRGLGNQDLYSAYCDVTGSGCSQRISVEQFGIRDIKLIQVKDNGGESFYFRINGIPVFSKGANFVPASSFPGTESEINLHLINMAIESGMNMLRVWGGGIYQDENFYAECDRNGIMVWQDFMFACSLYPSDSMFTENVRKEAEDNILRISNHPCLALWCGNNEIYEGWENWGWQKEYREKEKKEIIKGYNKIFREILPAVVNELNPEVSYIHTSPKHGWGKNESMTEGDSHYWGVWWGNEPFEVYWEKTGRFMSEFGFQAMPSLYLLKMYAERETDLILKSEYLKQHQKHPLGFETIDNYLNEYLPLYDNLEEYIYLTQLLQSHGIKTAVESHRIKKPYCMGTLFWQLNDCWPSISWSAIDFAGRPKALYYSLKEIYKPVIIAFNQRGSSVDLYIVSDKYEERKGRLEISVINFNGGILSKDNFPVKISSNSSVKYYSYNTDGLISDNEPLRRSLINAKLIIDDSIIYSANHYFVKDKKLLLPEPSIKAEISKEGKEYLIKLNSKVAARSVFVSLEDYAPETVLQENFIDLLPGEEKIIRFNGHSGLDLQMLNKNLKIISLYNIINKKIKQSIYKNKTLPIK